MTHRRTKTIVSFHHAFKISVLDEPLPAGTYEVEIEEELLEGATFVAYRLTGTVLHLPAAPDDAGPARAVKIDPADLEAAIRRDSGGRRSDIDWAAL
jgi:hypothetical protein